METAVSLTIILVILEFFEVMMQRADTLSGIMQRLYVWYRKSIFFFFLIHPTFYFIVFVMIASNRLNSYIVIILAMKIFDLFYKLELIKKIYVKKEIPPELADMLEWHIPSWFFLMGVLLYPPLFYYGLIA